MRSLRNHRMQGRLTDVLEARQQVFFGVDYSLQYDSTALQTRATVMYLTRRVA